MKSVLVDRVEYSAADIRGIIEKIRKDADILDAAVRLNGVANSLDHLAKQVDEEIKTLENVHKNMQDTPVRG